jgi:hypothetical protein
LKVAVATLGLAGAVYAADQATSPSEARDVTGLINAQRAAEGRLVNQGKPDEHQATPYTPAQLVEMTARYDGEMKTALAHADTLRITAYKSRDLIRMTCIEDKLAQMNDVMKAIEPAVHALAAVGSDELRMRQQFLSVQQARERVAELAVEMEECTGDNLVKVTAGRIKEEIPAETNNVFDPTRPPTATRDVERPPEASPYR